MMSRKIETPLTKQMGLQIAIKAAGSMRGLARLLEIAPQSIVRWKNGIPAERVVEVERVTGVPRSVLRPDLYLDQTVKK
jgi:DNA-binding transcriptional regulator YdaS (Cro superfamily)